MSDESSSAVDFSRLLGALWRLRRETNHLDTVFQEIAVSRSHQQALVEIAGAGTLPVGELAESLLLDKSTVSRLVAALESKGLVEISPDPVDRRRKMVSLTQEGRAQITRVEILVRQRFEEALSACDAEEGAMIADGVARVTSLLEQTRRRDKYEIRALRPGDNEGIAHLIRRVMTEYGAVGSGYSIGDPEVDNMALAYRVHRAGYWIVERDHRIVGGGGFAHLEGAAPHVCELRKMYFFREVRGLGLGRELYELIESSARRAGYSVIYAETTRAMTEAHRFYERCGYRPCTRLGATGHHGCDLFFVKDLRDDSD